VEVRANLSCALLYRDPFRAMVVEWRPRSNDVGAFEEQQSNVSWM